MTRILALCVNHLTTDNGNPASTELSFQWDVSNLTPLSTQIIVLTVLPMLQMLPVLPMLAMLTMLTMLEMLTMFTMLTMLTMLIMLTGESNQNQLCVFSTFENGQ